MLKRLLRPRSERHACLTLSGILLALMGSLILIKLGVWWAYASLLG